MQRDANRKRHSSNASANAKEKLVAVSASGAMVLVVVSMVVVVVVLLAFPLLMMLLGGLMMILLVVHEALHVCVTKGDSARWLLPRKEEMSLSDLDPS